MRVRVKVPFTKIDARREGLFLVQNPQRKSVRLHTKKGRVHLIWGGP